MRRPEILVVGSLVMDLICSTRRFPESGETVIGMDFQTAPGGKGANQAVQAARLGASVNMIGKVGNDDFGKNILKSVSESGVDVSGVSTSQSKPTAIGNIQLEVSESGTANRILVIPGANMDLSEEDVLPLRETISKYDMVILQLEIPVKINELVAKIAYENNVPVMLNSAPSAPLSDEFLSHLTFISPNEHEASDLTGIAVKDEDSAKAAIEMLLIKGVKNVLITMGSKGAVFGNTETFISSPSVDYGQVVDPTAAGDSFVAAFCTAVSLGAGFEQALLFANHTAGITVSRMGAQPSLPAIDEVLSFMQKNGHDISAFNALIGN